jgi:uncharacterized membrane protein
MMHSNTHTGASLPRRQFTPNIVSLNMANALVGRTVDLLVGTKKVAHGVVSGVLTEAGKPRIVVGKASYDMRQILTISPV